MEFFLNDKPVNINTFYFSFERIPGITTKDLKNVKSLFKEDLLAAKLVEGKYEDGVDLTESEIELFSNENSDFIPLICALSHQHNHSEHLRSK